MNVSRLEDTEQKTVPNGSASKGCGSVEEEAMNSGRVIRQALGEAANELSAEGRGFRSVEVVTGIQGLSRDRSEWPVCLGIQQVSGEGKCRIYKQRIENEAGKPASSSGRL